MFGGYGVYAESGMFAIVWRSTVYFKTNETTREAYRAHAMCPFEPKPGKVLKTFYQVPLEVLEDERELRQWAKRAMQAATTLRAGARRVVPSHLRGGA